MDSWKTNELQLEDHEEDFETILANRRCQRNYTEARDDIQAAEPANNQAPETMQTPYQVERTTMTLNAEQVTAPNALHTPDFTATDQSVQAKMYRDADECKISTFDNFQSSPDNHWQISLPSHEAMTEPSSSLFVQQHPRLSTTSSFSYNQLIPSAYDSESQSTSRSGPPSVSSSRSIRQAKYGDSTRDATTQDVFSKSNYVHAMRRNPYTSGIFDYKGLSKEELKQKLELQVEKVRGKATNRKTLRSIKASGSREKRRDAKTISKPIEAKPARQSSVQTPSTGANATSLVQKSNPLSQSSAVQQGSSVQRQPLSAPRSHTLPLYQSEQSRAVAEANVARLADSLSRKAGQFGNALKMLDCSYGRESPHWQSLELQIRPEINEFAERLRNEQALDVDDFKIALEAWEMNLGLQVMLQKYIMYSLLLERVKA